MHDKKRPGRTCRLSDEQLESLDKDIEKNLVESGFKQTTWTAKLVTRHIWQKFGVKYSNSGVLKVMKRLNFSIRKHRPIPYNSVTPEKLKKYVDDNTKNEIKIHDKMGYKIMCMDAATFVDTPMSRRGIRRRGGRDTIKINYSRNSIKVIDRCIRQRYTRSTIS